MPEKRLPAITIRAIWKEITFRRTGRKNWDTVVEKIGKDLGGGKKRFYIEKFGGYKTEGK